MKRSGFTLIELSIVLVIIGLITAGVLVGRDLIRAAEIRQTISQFQSYDLAVNAFKLKYNCLPGDCLDVVAVGFAAASAGNNDGIIGECASAVMACGNGIPGGGPIQEIFQFWYHLSAANMINNFFPVWSGSLSGNYIILENTAVPKPKINVVGVGHGAFYMGPGGWAPMGDIKYSVLFTAIPPQVIQGHAFILGQRIPFGPVPGGSLGSSYIGVGGYNPADIYAIDIKIDDGKPINGTALAYNAFSVYPGPGHTRMLQLGNSFTDTAPGGIFCTYTDNGITEYNLRLASGSGTPGACGLIMKASF